MKYKISHIETDTEIYIKFTIWVQTFTLAPFIKEKDNKIKKSQIYYYKKHLKNALDNLLII